MVTRFYLCNHITFDWTVPQHVGSSMVLNLDALGIMQSFTKRVSIFVELYIFPNKSSTFFDDYNYRRIKRNAKIHKGFCTFMSFTFPRTNLIGSSMVVELS